MNETNVDEKVTSDDIVKKLSHSILVAFFSAVLLCCGLYGYVIYLHNGHIVEGQNRIISIYDRQMKKMESTNPSMSIREKQREDEMRAFHQEVKTLLELEYNRIQNEFEAIEIWTGVLTVIFLIFSFYSLFKTEQLENQSKDELKRIKKIGEDGETKLDSFDTNSNNALEAVKSSVEKIEQNSKDQIDSILKGKKADALVDFDKRAKEILEAYVTRLNGLVAENKASVEKSYALYEKKIQSILEKDLDLGEYDEEEFDEEELSDNQESEGKEN
ncbi:MAG: hypothetical protein J5952_09325 [Prevotella sp.]|nr:hypothetical protein [Prevotella sp.]MBO5580599.1 hypothetical protein [Prevotella sp.]